MGDKEVLFQGKFLQVIRDQHWEYVERINASGAVMVIAVTPQDEMILVEEYRYPVDAHVIGLPAGICGDQGEESGEDAARRELEEETGYTAREWFHLFDGPSSPGLASEMVAFYLAGGLEKVSHGGGVDQEQIIVHTVPVSSIGTWLMEQQRAGKMIDPRVYAGLYFLQ